MLIVAIIGGLALVFTFIISMAVGNGIIASLWYDTDRAKKGQIAHSRQTGYIISEYKRMNPGGRRHLKAYLAWAIAAASMATFIACVYLLEHFWH